MPYPPMQGQPTGPLSPATSQAMGVPAPEEEARLFEEKFGQMAYQVFNSQFPDLVGSIVTFKIIDSNIENNSAVGAFILDHQGQFIYVPVVLSDNQLKPLDLAYVKDEDIFVPLTTEWIDELSKGTLNTLGEGVKMPKTVATDVDIRNIVVPPTTGRYSYASVSPKNRLAAEASEPLGRKLHKLASSVGESTTDEFNPEVWTTFNEQFQRIQGMSPGQAIDGSTMDVSTLAKMYKQHSKTWDLANQSAYAQGMDPSQMNSQPQAGGMPQQQMPQQQAAMPQQAQAPMQMRTASVASEAAERAISETARKSPSFGAKLDSMLSLMGSGAVGGAAIGGVRAGMDQDLSEVPGGMIRGAVGGAIGAPIGRALGTAVGRSDVGKKYIGFDDARGLGAMLGGATGGFIGARGNRTNYERLRHPFSYDTMATDPYGGMVITGSDHNANLASLFKHAAAKGHDHKQILPEFLKKASNNVKRGFAKVLTNNPKLLKMAGDIYGEDTLLDALQPTEVKTAGISTAGGALQHADKNTKPSDYFQSFGAAAPEAFNGVLLKGYHFKDTRPSLNLAVQTQEYHDFQDTRESGVYLVYPLNKKPEAALVITEPVDIFKDDRATFPRDHDSKVKHVKTHVPFNEQIQEPDSMSRYELDGHAPRTKDVERSHTLQRLFILGNGRYGVTPQLMGEQVAEIALKNTTIFKTVMSDGNATPRAGKGIFIYKRGAHYFSTMPLELSDVTTDSQKVLRAKARAADGYGWGQKTIVIDPKSPMGRISRPRETDLVLIPGRWKWLPLNDRLDSREYLSQSTELTRILIDAMGSAGVSEVVARRAGQSMYAVNGDKTTDKVSALRKLAEDYRIHITAAEAMLKIAEAKNICKAYIVSPSQYTELRQKIADMVPPAPPGMAMPPAAPAAPPNMGTMGAPPAMGAPPPAPMDPNAQMGAMAAPPMPSAVDQAFQETTEALQQQINELQAQLNVLTTVQERANQIEGGEQIPQDPNAMAAPAPMDPGMDPNAQMQQPPMPPAMDPMAQQQQAAPPPMPVMHTEEPSSEEIAAQINPNFLAQAGQFHDMGAFDAGAVGSLAQTPSLQNISTQYAANLEDSVDDLGRTLLTLYMQESELKEQLGDDAFVKLETQLRDTFKNLGMLTLNLSHNTAQLNNHSATT